ELPAEVLRRPVEQTSRPPASRAGRPLSRRGAMLAAAPTPFPVVWALRPFVPGIPGVDAFPFDLWRRLMARHWLRSPAEVVIYGDPAGYRPLREAIAAYLGATRGVRCGVEQVVIVGGSQQALGVAARLLVDEGDAGWIDDP